MLYIGNVMLTNSLQNRVFRALSDPTRRQIIAKLADQPLPVHRISSAFDLTRPAVSRHLRILKEAGLVGLAGSGRENVYHLKTSTLREVEEWLNGIWARRLSKLKSLVEEATDE